jgi:hypothetical protein
VCALPLLGSSGTAARIHIFVWPCTARGSRLSCKTPPLITGDKSEYEPRAQSACAYKAGSVTERWLCVLRQWQAHTELLRPCVSVISLPAVTCG